MVNTATSVPHHIAADAAARPPGRRHTGPRQGQLSDIGRVYVHSAYVPCLVRLLLCFRQQLFCTRRKYCDVFACMHVRTVERKLVIGVIDTWQWKSSTSLGSQRSRFIRWGLSTEYTLPIHCDSKKTGPLISFIFTVTLANVGRIF